MVGCIDIDEISARLSAREPGLLSVDGSRHAAVAMILRAAGNGAEVLFIERTRNEADPWSGQMAFPGGMVETHDAGPRDAAQRETLEEVGLDLTGARFMGRLDDVQARRRGQPINVVVSGFVYFDEQGQDLAPNYEVAEVVWEPLASFADAGRLTYVEFPRLPGERFPGIRVGRAAHQVVWGLTRRFLVSFFDIVGQPFAVEPAYSQQHLEGE